jgi:hypothetical protein
MTPFNEAEEPISMGQSRIPLICPSNPLISADWIAIQRGSLWNGRLLQVRALLTPQMQW